VTGSQLETKISLKDYSVSNRGCERICGDAGAGLGADGGFTAVGVDLGAAAVESAGGGDGAFGAQVIRVGLRFSSRRDSYRPETDRIRC